MSDLSRYSQFRKERKKEEPIITTRDVWLYTRVSSKDQTDNFSLENQRDAAEKYAEENGYKITKYFGNLNESASKDYTRKEFQALINEVKKARRKPFGILVYVISRFSRSGGGAVGILNELVEDLRVHLIEVTSGLDTASHVGRITIERKLLDANDENYIRKQHTLPGMKKFVETGQNFGVAPIGYDHYGPRVSDPSKRRINQEIVINDDGIKLRKAWYWKLEGLTDAEILGKLDAIGLRITKQRLSEVWRRPFYIGVQNNKFLGNNQVKGNWEPMIPEKVFWAVQRILDGNHQGYTVEKNNRARPLTGTLVCLECGKKLTGYEVKKKGLHYYNCPRCKGVNINAKSSQKMNTKGAHQMFMELLESYRLDESLIQPFIMQLKKTFTSMNKGAIEDRAVYSKRIKKLESELDTLDERFAFGVFDNEALYQRLRAKKQDEIDQIRGQLQDSELKISNLDSYIENSIEISQNIHNYWQLGTLEEKRKLQKMVFPEGIVIDTKNRVYLTSKVNSLFLAKSQFQRDSEGGNKKLPIKNDEESCLVAGVGLEPTTFGL